MGAGLGGSALKLFNSKRGGWGDGVRPFRSDPLPHTKPPPAAASRMRQLLVGVPCRRRRGKYPPSGISPELAAVAGLGAVRGTGGGRPGSPLMWGGLYVALRYYWSMWTVDLSRNQLE